MFKRPFSLRLCKVEADGSLTPGLCVQVFIWCCNMCFAEIEDVGLASPDNAAGAQHTHCRTHCKSGCSIEEHTARLGAKWDFEVRA